MTGEEWSGDHILSNEGNIVQQILRRTRQPLTARQVRTLHSKPIVLVEGVPGKILWPVAGIVAYGFKTKPYTDQAGYLKVGGGLFIADLSALLSQVVSSIIPMYPGYPLPGIPLPIADFLGAPLTAEAEADPDGGDGTMNIGVIYRVVTAGA